MIPESCKLHGLHPFSKVFYGISIPHRLFKPGNIFHWICPLRTSCTFTFTNAVGYDAQNIFLPENAKMLYGVLCCMQYIKYARILPFLS